MFVDPVIANATLDLHVGPGVLAGLPALAKGRPLVIDYWARRQRGLTLGDLSMRFGDPSTESRFVRLEPINGVDVLVEEHLLPLLEGATLRLSRPPFLRRVRQPPHAAAVT
jgi:hypothetical protein